MTNDATGAVLSHVQAMYRPGERQIAIDLFEALGCAIYDTGAMDEAGATIISVHPDPSERGRDNVIFLSEMPAAQVQLDAVLQRRIDADDEVSASYGRYREFASERPFGLFHFAVRYPSFEALELVLAGMEDRLTPELKPRVTLKVFRPAESGRRGTKHFQAFIYTDVVTSGISAFGQVLELGAFRSAQ